MSKVKILLLMALGSLSAFAAPTVVVISQVMYRADGSPYNSGQVTVEWPNFIAASGDQIPAGSKTVNLTTAGLLQVSLVANAGASPVGTSYRVTYRLALGTPASVAWIVPAVAGPVTVTAIQSGAQTWVPYPVITQSMLPVISVPFYGTGATSFTANLPIFGNGTNPLFSGTVQGNQTKLVSASGTWTTGHCLTIDGNGNAIDAGAPCGTPGGGFPTTTNLISGNGGGGGADSGIVPATVVINTRTISTTGPLGGGGALSGNLTLTCTTCLIGSSLSAGVVHAPGASQTMTSSLIVNADIAAATIDLPTKVTGLLLGANMATMIGDSGSGGTKGAVPAPAAGDAAAGKYLKADGTFSVPPGSGSITGPMSSTNTAIPTWNGTGGNVLRDSLVLIDTATGNVSTPGTYSSGTGGASRVDLTNGVDPSSPGVGVIYLYSQTAANNVFAKTSAGTLIHMVQSATTANQVVRTVPDSGAITQGPVTSAYMSTEPTRRTCTMVIGADNGTALANADLGPQGQQCQFGAAGTVVEVDVNADGGTPSIQVGKMHCSASSGGVCTAWTNSSFLSSALSAAASNFDACSNTGGTTGIDTITTCSATLQNTSVVVGDWIRMVSGTAGGTAKRVTVTVHLVTTN